jgi:hypothetical protein
MPYARYAQERLPYYMKAIKQIGGMKVNNPQTVEKELLIRCEIIRRDLTKRQMNILILIFTFSRYLGKERAVIPKMRDFEICGVSKIKIRSELTKLVELDVLDWNEEENSFCIRDPKEWKVKYNTSYNDDRAWELFILNLRDAGVDVKDAPYFFEQGFQNG